MSDPSKAVFLSYASQDAEAAAEITRSLRDAGIEVWFDQSELRGGDAWDASIRKQIKACTLFVPVISRNTHAREEGYFRLEWKLAVDRSHLMAASKTFLLPVVIDDTRDDDDRVPDRFREVQWTRLAGGKVPPAFIERIAKLLDVDRTPAGAAAGAAVSRSATPAGAAVGGRKMRPLLWIGAAALAGICALEVYRTVEWRHEGSVPAPPATPANPISQPPAALATPSSSTIPEKSIAVLPFVDMSEKKDQEYFSDGLADELLDLLAQVRELRVAARTSSFSFKGKADDIATIAQKLRVAHVLEGSVRRSGDVIRVSAQLIRADNGYDLWSKTYDRQVKDIFKVQDEIAAAVVDALKLQLLPSQQILSRHWTPNTEAYTQYLLGVRLRATDSLESNDKALVAYRKAVALDPNYAAAYAGLSDAEWRVADQSSNDPDIYIRALDAANKAIALAPDTAEGYWARGNLRNYHDWNWDGAQSDYEKALTLDPNFVAAYVSFANVLATRSHLAEAEAMLRKALALDPLGIDTWRRLGFVTIQAGRYDEALAAAERIREINPEMEDRLVGLANLFKGRPEEALAAFHATTSRLKLQGIAMAEFSLGHREASDAALNGFIKERGPAFAYQYAEAYGWRGEADKAFEWLQTALLRHDGGLSYTGYDRTLVSLHGDPRFKALLQKLNLAPAGQ